MLTWARITGHREVYNSNVMPLLFSSDRCSINSTGSAGLYL